MPKRTGVVLPLIMLMQKDQGGFSTEFLRNVFTALVEQYRKEDNPLGLEDYDIIAEAQVIAFIRKHLARKGVPERVREDWFKALPQLKI